MNEASYDIVLVDADEEGVDTVAGLIAKRLGKVALPGSSITIDGWTLTAEQAAGRRNRITTVLAERAEARGPVRTSPRAVTSNGEAS